MKRFGFVTNVSYLSHPSRSELAFGFVQWVLLRSGFQKIPNFCKIFAEDYFFTRIPQDIGRMDGSNRFGASKLVELPMNFCDPLLDAEHRPRGGSTQAADQARLNRFDLAEEKRRASGDFIRFGGSIARGPAFDDIADVNVLALNLDKLQHLVQELPGPSHKRQSLFIFVGAWPFTNKDKLCMWIPLAKDDMLACFPKLATLAVAQVRTNLFKGFLLLGRRRIGRGLKEA